MTTQAALNQELGSYGYHETFAWHDSNYQVRRLDGYGGHVATFKDVSDVQTFLGELAASDNPWCIDLDHGNVDVDRATGHVTPRDGGPSFDLHNRIPTSGPLPPMTLPRDSRPSCSPLLKSAYNRVLDRRMADYGSNAPS